MHACLENKDMGIYPAMPVGRGVSGAEGTQANGFYGGLERWMPEGMVQAHSKETHLCFKKEDDIEEVNTWEMTHFSNNKEGDLDLTPGHLRFTLVTPSPSKCEYSKFRTYFWIPLPRSDFACSSS